MMFVLSSKSWRQSWKESGGAEMGEESRKKIFGKTEVSSCFYSLCAVIGRITNKLLLGFRQKHLFLGISSTEDASKH